MTGVKASSCSGAEETALSAGAEGSLFVSPAGWLLEMRPEQELPMAEAAALLRRLTGASLILVEGYKGVQYPKIALCRRDVSLALPCPEEELLAVVCDVPLDTALPQFSYEEIKEHSFQPHRRHQTGGGSVRPQLRRGVGHH